MPQNSNIHFGSKPVIGLLGGCGPYATLDIERKLLSATYTIVNPLIDQNYYPMIVSYNTQLPDRSKAKGNGRTELVFQLKESLEQLLSLNVNILLLTCQSAHVFLEDIQSNLGKVAFVSMIDVTIKKVLSYCPRWKRVGLIGTDILYSSNLYQDTLKNEGIEVIIPPQFLQKHVMQAIYSIKAHGVDFFSSSLKSSDISSSGDIDGISNHTSLTRKEILAHSIQFIKDAISFIQDQGVDGIVLGCTELPLLLPYLSPYFPESILIDPNRLSAEQVILHAYEMEKNNVENSYVAFQQTQYKK